MADLALFARIVQAGSISKCAVSLGAERTTVSRRLGALERSLGVKLLDRSPKRLSMTDAGRRCFEECKKMLAIAKSADFAATRDVDFQGQRPIVVGAPPDIFDHFLEAMLVEFESVTSDIVINRYPVSGWSEGIFSAVDLLIGWEPPADSACTSRNLCAMKQSMYASPDFISRHGYPKSLDELHRLPCVVVGSIRENHLWRFKYEEEWVDVSINKHAVVSSLVEAREAVVAGHGAAMLPDYLCEPFVRSGGLTRVFSKIETSKRNLVAASALESQSDPLSAALRMFLKRSFQASTRESRPRLAKQFFPRQASISEICQQMGKAPQFRP